jgi:hypothetical protein
MAVASRVDVCGKIFFPDWEGRVRALVKVYLDQ